MKWTLSVIIGAVIVLGAIIVASSKTRDDSIEISPVGAYELSGEKMDLGEMGVDDKKTATFTFKNTSTERMNLSRFETSCNCTMAEVKMNGETSPMFNMPAHMSATERNWNGDLAAGDSAEINVTYEPALMPVYGFVERYATFKVNNSKTIKLTVSTTVK